MKQTIAIFCALICYGGSAIASSSESKPHDPNINTFMDALEVLAREAVEGSPEAALLETLKKRQEALEQLYAAGPSIELSVLALKVDTFFHSPAYLEQDDIVQQATNFMEFMERDVAPIELTPRHKLPPAEQEALRASMNLLDDSIARAQHKAATRTDLFLSPGSSDQMGHSQGWDLSTP